MHIRLEAAGSSLITRARGAEIRHKALDAIGDEQELLLDFAGVRHASYSFVDELVGKLASMSRSAELSARVEVANTDDVIQMHVDRCLTLRTASAAA